MKHMNLEKILNKNRRFKVRWFFVLLCVLLIAGLLPNASDSVEAASGKWRHDSGGWWYSYSGGGYAQNEWVKISGKWYHFDGKGYMQTGWKKINGSWYYFSTSGAMQTGWKKLNGEWYYFDRSGEMVTGTKIIGGVRYHFDSNGHWIEETAMLKMKIGETEVDVRWENNSSVDSLMKMVVSKPLTIKLSMYGGFEQVGSIGQSLPRNDTRITTSSGDIVLYSGNQVVVFYGSNSWAYTRLGHITNKTASEMKQLLGNGDVMLTIY